jgi:TonB family protein
MAYRDDLAALEARKATAEAELLEKTRARDDAARLVEEARYLARAEAAFTGNGHDSLRRTARRAVRWLGVAAVVIAGVGGLTAHSMSRPAMPPWIDLGIFQMAAYHRAMCGCTELEYPRSSECVQRISDEMTRWGSAFATESPEPPKLDDSQTKRVMAIAQGMGACMQQAMTPPAPPPPVAIAQPESQPCDEVSCVLDNYEGACCAAFAHAAALPDAIDRSMITEAIAGVKWRVRACADTSAATGKVKVHVKVDSTGRIAGVSVVEAPDPELGTCVADAVRKATFAKTQSGGTFSYPFVF